MSTQDQQGTLVGATVEIQFATPIRYSAVSSPILTAMLRRNIPFGPSYPVSVSCKAHVRKRFGGKPGQAHSGEILIDSNRTSTVAIGTQMLSKDCCRRVGVFCSKSIVWQAWRLSVEPLPQSTGARQVHEQPLLRYFVYLVHPRTFGSWLP